MHPCDGPLAGAVRTHLIWSPQSTSGSTGLGLGPILLIFASRPLQSSSGECVLEVKDADQFSRLIHDRQLAELSVAHDVE